MFDVPKGVKMNRSSGLPKYVHRKGRRGYLYFCRREYIERLPDFDSESFWPAYQEALAQMPLSGFLPKDAFRHDGMTKNKLDAYFAGIQRGARQRALKAGREYSLSDTWAADRYVQQDGRCALSGIVMRQGEGRLDPFSPSIDRIDSSLGYTDANCQLVLLQINLGKGILSEEEYVNMCRAVARFCRRTEGEQTENFENAPVSFETPIAKTGRYGNIEMVEEHIKTVRSQ